LPCQNLGGRFKNKAGENLIDDLKINNKHKNIFTLLLCVLSTSVAAQHLKHIPDENLKDGFVLVNLENKKWKLYDVVPAGSDSSHDTSHNLTFTFFTTTNTIKLNYHFKGGTIDGIPSQDTGPIINWLYAYKLVSSFVF